MDDHLHCVTCGECLLKRGDVCLYQESTKSQHLIIRPAASDATGASSAVIPAKLAKKLSTLPEVNPKKSKYFPQQLICAKCQGRVGKGGKLGPDGELVWCLGKDKLTWRSSIVGCSAAQRLIDQLQVRTRATLFGDCTTALQRQAEAKLSTQVPQARFVDLPDGECDIDLKRLTRLKPREYQLELFVLSLERNSVVCLPTGMGKTLIASLVMQQMQQWNPGRWAVMVTPTIPLAEQQASSLKSYAVQNDLRVDVVYGENSTTKQRRQLVDRRCGGMLVVTPQCLIHMLEDNFHMAQLSVLVLDECHHATSDDSLYGQLVRSHYEATPVQQRPLLLGLSASPCGGSKVDVASDRLESILERLHSRMAVPQRHRQQLLEFRQNLKLDVAEVLEYAADEAIKVMLQEVALGLTGILGDVLGEIVRVQGIVPLQLAGLVEPQPTSICRAVRLRQVRTAEIGARKCLKVLGEVRQAIVGDNQRASGEQLFDKLVQSVAAANDVWVRAAECGTMGGYRALIGLKSDMDMRVSDLQGPLRSSYENAMQMINAKLSTLAGRGGTSSSGGACLQGLQDTCSLPARAEKLIKVLEASSDAQRILVFTKQRSTAHFLCQILGRSATTSQLNPLVVVGHGGFDGMQWDGYEGQQDVIDQFRRGESRLLVATSVLEEGLDVPVCNLVVRYDGVADVRALIQSRGRARAKASKYVVLCDDEQRQKLASSREVEDAMMLLAEERAWALTPRGRGALESLLKQQLEMPSTNALQLEVVPTHTIPSNFPYVTLHVRNCRPGWPAEIRLEAAVEIGQMFGKVETVDEGPQGGGVMVGLQLWDDVQRSHSTLASSLLSVAPMLRNVVDKEEVGGLFDSAVLEIQSFWRHVEMSSRESALPHILAPSQWVYFGDHFSEARFLPFSRVKFSSTMAICIGGRQRRICFELAESPELPVFTVDVASVEAIVIGILPHCAEMQNLKGAEQDVAATKSDICDLAVSLKLRYAPTFYSSIYACVDMANDVNKVQKDYQDRQKSGLSARQLFEEACYATLGNDPVHDALYALDVDALFSEEPWFVTQSFTDLIAEMSPDVVIEQDIRVPASKVLEWRDGGKPNFVHPCDSNPSGLGWVRYEVPKVTGADLARHLAFWIKVHPSPRICQACPVEWERKLSVSGKNSDQVVATGLSKGSEVQLADVQPNLLLRPAPNNQGSATVHQSLLQLSDEVAATSGPIWNGLYMSDMQAGLALLHIATRHGIFVANAVHLLVDLYYPKLSLRAPLLYQLAGVLLAEENTSMHIKQVLNVCQTRLEVVGTAIDSEIGPPIPLTSTSVAEAAQTQLISVHGEVPYHYVPVNRVHVTPSLVAALPPIRVPTNMLLRMSGLPPAAFLLVALTDENGKQWPHVSLPMAWRVHRLLRRGLVLAGRHYLFLGASSSQIRGRHFWMVCEKYAHPSQLLCALGPGLLHVNLVRFLPRAGLFLTTTTDAGEVHPHEIVVLQDVKRNKYCFTDGCGLISRDKAKHVAATLGMEHIPSAFQVRLGGSKGMLMVTDHLPDGKSVALRPSMIKFISTHLRIGIVAASRPLPASLNRQTLLLLVCCHPRSRSRVMELLQDQLSRMEDALLKDHDARQLLEPLLAGMPIPLASASEVGLGPLTDRFLRSILKESHMLRLGALRDKSRIEVKRGVVLFGVADYTGTLAPNQVYVSLSADLAASALVDTSNMPNGGGTTVVGRVLVMKNPCHLVSDLQLLQACGDAEVHPALRGLFDVIVFSIQGKRPVADCIAGSDLDGDQFTVVWDDALVPQLREGAQPELHEEYASQYYRNQNAHFAGMQTEQQVHPTVADDITSEVHCRMVEGVLHVSTIAYLLHGESSNLLGRIANAHVAFADKYSPSCKACKSLAVLHQLEVDCVKTGKHAKLPDKLQPAQYPHYMRQGSNTYRSISILGDVYDEAMSLPQDLDIDTSDNLGSQDHEPPLAISRLLASTATAAQEIRETIQVSRNHISFCGVLPVDLSPVISRCVDQIYKSHVAQIKTMLGTYGFTSEATVIAGNVRDGGVGGGKHARHVLAAARQQIRAVLRLSSADLKKWLDCWAEGMKTETREMLAMHVAAVCYLRAYRGSRVGSSFSWVLGKELVDGLRMLKLTSGPVEPSLKPNFPISTDMLQALAKASSLNLANGLAAWLAPQLPKRIRSFTERLQVAEIIKQNLQLSKLTSVLRGYDLGVFGSSLTQLLEVDDSHLESDLDLVLAKPGTHFDELDTILQYVQSKYPARSSETNDRDHQISDGVGSTGRKKVERQILDSFWSPTTATQLDICREQSTGGSDSRERAIQLLQRVEQLLRMDWNGVRLIEAAKVPIVRAATVGSAIPLSGAAISSVDISAQGDGVRNSSRILAGLWAAPAVWPALLLLIAYLRREGVVRHGGGAVRPSDVAVLALRHWYYHFANVLGDYGECPGDAPAVFNTSMQQYFTSQLDNRTDGSIAGQDLAAEIKVSWEKMQSGSVHGFNTTARAVASDLLAIFAITSNPQAHNMNGIPIREYHVSAAFLCHFLAHFKGRASYPSNYVGSMDGNSTAETFFNGAEELSVHNATAFRQACISMAFTLAHKGGDIQRVLDSPGGLTVLRVGRTSYLNKAWAELNLKGQLEQLLADAKLKLKITLASYGMDCALRLQGDPNDAQLGRQILLPHIRYMTYTWTRAGGIFLRRAVALVMESAEDRRAPARLEPYSGRVQPEHWYPVRHKFYLPRTVAFRAANASGSTASPAPRHVHRQIAQVLMRQFKRLGHVQPGIERLALVARFGVLYTGVRLDEVNEVGISQLAPNLTVAQLERGMNRNFDAKRMYRRMNRRYGQRSKTHNTQTGDVQYTGDAPSTESSGPDEAEEEELRLSNQPAHQSGNQRKKSKQKQKLRVVSSFLTCTTYRLESFEKVVTRWGFASCEPMVQLSITLMVAGCEVRVVFNQIGHHWQLHRVLDRGVKAAAIAVVSGMAPLTHTTSDSAPAPLCDVRYSAELLQNPEQGLSRVAAQLHVRGLDVDHVEVVSNAYTVQCVRWARQRRYSRVFSGRVFRWLASEVRQWNDPSPDHTVFAWSQVGGQGSERQLAAAQVAVQSGGDGIQGPWAHQELELEVGSGDSSAVDVQAPSYVLNELCDAWVNQVAAMKQALQQ